VAEPSASTAFLHLGPGVDDRLLVDQRALVGAHELLQHVLVLAALGAIDHDLLGIDVGHGPGAPGQHDVTGVDGRTALHACADHRSIGDEQRNGLGLHVRAHQRPVGVVVLEERDHGGRDRPDLLGGDVDQVDAVCVHGHVLTRLRAAEDLIALQAALAIHRRVGLGDDPLLLLGGVQVDDLIGHDALAHDAVGRGDEAVL
jgi:hypothetical protein